ncbi:MAG: archaeosortase/exosortase family protein [Patescibacteria group bacterium]
MIHKLWGSFSSHLRGLLLRFVIFSILFIAVSGIIGPWVIGTPLLYEYGFYIYANLGKMVLFSAILLVLLTRGRIDTVQTQQYSWHSLIYLIFSGLLIPLFFVLGSNLLENGTAMANIPLLVTAHLTIVAIPLLLIPGVFGLQTVSSFVNTFKKEICICFAISVIYFFAIFQVWKLWPYLSNLVLVAVHFLFGLFYDVVFVMPPRSLFVEGFAVSIEESCSGVDSLFLFMTLYLIIAVLDWKRFNKIKIVLMAIPAVLGLILVNVIRVFVLILVGVEISPQLSAQLFHTYLGMVFFFIYFVVFWRLSYDWMMRS